MIKQVNKNKNRQRKHAKIRRTLSGTTEIPRISVYRSNKHIYAQLIDDQNATTLVSASTLDSELNLSDGNTGSVGAAKAVGELLGERAKKAGFEKVVFDRSGYIYHGRVAALAEGARSAGLAF